MTHSSTTVIKTCFTPEYTYAYTLTHMYAHITKFHKTTLILITFITLYYFFPFPFFKGWSWLHWFHVNSYKPQSGKHWSEGNLTLDYKGQADPNPVPRSPTIPRPCFRSHLEEVKGSAYKDPSPCPNKLRLLNTYLGISLLI